MKSIIKNLQGVSEREGHKSTQNGVKMKRTAVNSNNWPPLEGKTVLDADTEKYSN